MRGKKRWIRTVPFVCYCLFIVWYTILSRKPGVPKAELRFMWSYREMFIGDPNWKKDVIQNLQNIAFFIPFGFFAPAKRWIGVFMGALLFSVCVETIQYIGGYGLAEVDDVICNTLGAAIGFGLWKMIKGKINAT